MSTFLFWNQINTPTATPILYSRPMRWYGGVYYIYAENYLTTAGLGGGTLAAAWALSKDRAMTIINGGPTLSGSLGFGTNSLNGYAPAGWISLVLTDGGDTASFNATILEANHQDSVTPVPTPPA